MVEALAPIGMLGTAFNVRDKVKFETAVRLLKESLAPEIKEAFFCCDNLLTWNRNLSFLRDEFFVGIINDQSVTDIEKSAIWRTYVLLYFAQVAANREGDFLEIGCHTGHTAAQLLRKVDLASIGKRYFLYDLFGWSEGDEHTHMTGHDDPQMYEKVKARFADRDFVTVIRGAVPDSFAQGFPEKVAFAHIDMNHPVPEAAALKEVLPRLSSGGVVIFDDYGWYGYCLQKMALDPIAQDLAAITILELPTGQGILIKP